MKQILLLIICISITAVSYAKKEKADDLIEKGISLQNKGKYDKAIATYEKALGIDSQSAKACYELANTYSMVNDFDKAMLYCEQFLELDGEKPDYYNLAGMVYASNNQADEAMAILRKGIDIYPQDYQLWRNLAMLYYDNNMDDEAESAIITSIKLNPTDAESHRLLSSIMSKTNQRIKSIMALYSTLTLSPYTSESPVLYYLLLDNLKQEQIEKDNARADKYFETNISLAKYARKYNQTTAGDKNRIEQFVDYSTYLFSEIEKIETQNDNDFWEEYSRVYLEILDQGKMDVLCYYIALCTHSKSAFNWLETNKRSLNDLLGFLRNRNFHLASPKIN